jgi:hypothetical protein
MFLAVGLVAAGALPLYASHNKGGNGGNCCGSNDSCGSSVTYECVPETYNVTRTSYKKVCREETYTAYKCVCEPVTKTREVTHMVRKQVEKEVCRNVTERIPCTETRTVMKSHWSYQTVTEMKTKRVDRGHWTCEEVPAHFQNFLAKCKGGFGHGHRGNDCCEQQCQPEPCPKTRTVKKWCSNWVTECYPVTCCKKVCTQTPETCQVTTYKCVTRQVTCKELCWVCEPCTRTETYTCNVQRQVPYTCTRQVWECVPFQETVACTRYVKKAIPCAAPAPAPVNCAPVCETTTSCCETSSRCGGHGLFGGLRNKMGGHGHRNNNNCGGCGVETSCGGGCH